MSPEQAIERVVAYCEAKGWPVEVADLGAVRTTDGRWDVGKPAVMGGVRFLVSPDGSIHEGSGSASPRVRWKHVPAPVVATAAAPATAPAPEPAPAEGSADRGFAYVSVAAACPETLRGLMLEFRKKAGAYGLPFAINPDPDGCDLCRLAVRTMRSPDGTFEATIPVTFLASLDTSRDTTPPHFTAYRIFASECSHIFYLWVSDILYPILANVCEQVTVHDDRNLGAHFLRTTRDSGTSRAAISPDEARYLANWLLAASESSEAARIL